MWRVINKNISLFSYSSEWDRQRSLSSSSLLKAAKTANKFSCFTAENIFRGECSKTQCEKPWEALN